MIPSKKSTSTEEFNHKTQAPKRQKYNHKVKSSKANIAMAIQHPIHLLNNTMMNISKDEGLLKTKKVSNKKQEKRVIGVHHNQDVQGKLWPRALLQAMKKARRGRRKMKKLMKKKLMMVERWSDHSKEDEENKVTHVFLELDGRSVVEEDESTSRSLSTSTTATGWIDTFPNPLSCQTLNGILDRTTPSSSSATPCCSITVPTSSAATQAAWKQNGGVFEGTGNPGSLSRQIYNGILRRNTLSNSSAASCGSITFSKDSATTKASWKRAPRLNSEGFEVSGNIWSRSVANVPLA